MTLGSTKPNSSRSMVVELPLDTTALVDKMARGCGHGGVVGELDGVEMLVPCLVSAVQAAAQGVNDGSNRAFAEPVGLRMIMRSCCL